MTKDERQAIDEIANALQAASPLSTALRQGLGDVAQHAVDLRRRLTARYERSD